MNKLQILAKYKGFEIGVLTVGLVYLEYDGKVYTEDNPMIAVHKVGDKEIARELQRQILEGR